MKEAVGVIGNGFVGEAVAFAFSPVYEVKVYDIEPLKTLNTLDEVLNCKYVFICVPTPMNSDGTQNISLVENVFNKLIEGPIYILKSTTLPGTVEKLEAKHPKLDIVFNPEFLTQRTSKLDMLTQARIILGGKRELTEKVAKVFEKRFMNRHFIHTDYKTAELIKYMNNTFFATKVSIMNEFKLLTEALDANWNDALYGFASDGRIGDSHLQVPGPDGKLGYGGACFPKDVNAFIKFADSMGIDLKTIKGGWETNKTVRKEWK